MKKVLFLVIALFTLRLSAQQKNIAANNSCTAYLFTYFTASVPDEEAIRFAISDDGYHWKALNNNNPVIPSDKISATGGVRDPHILRGVGRKAFYMVATDMHVVNNGWGPNYGMVLLKSRDLIHWRSSIVDIRNKYPGNDNLERVWAPQTIYDIQAKKYMIYWSMKHTGENDAIYYAYVNKDFTTLEGQPKKLFSPKSGNFCIDADIIYSGKSYHIFYKTGDSSGSGIRQATAQSLTPGKWEEFGNYLQQTTDVVEGSGIFKLNNGNVWILMYDVYTKGKYQFTKSTDLINFTVIDKDITMDFHPRHGTVLPITSNEAMALRNAFPCR